MAEAHQILIHCFISTPPATPLLPLLGIRFRQAESAKTARHLLHQMHQKDPKDGVHVLSTHYISSGYQSQSRKLEGLMCVQQKAA